MNSPDSFTENIVEKVPKYSALELEFLKPAIKSFFIFSVRYDLVMKVDTLNRTIEPIPAGVSMFPRTKHQGTKYKKCIYNFGRDGQFDPICPVCPRNYEKNIFSKPKPCLTVHEAQEKFKKHLISKSNEFQIKLW